MELQLKTIDRQCVLSTGVLNTEDNNWELGQTDWFVGRQLADCNGFQAILRIRIRKYRYSGTFWPGPGQDTDLEYPSEPVIYDITIRR
jgi:hypothetical protein